MIAERCVNAAAVGCDTLTRRLEVAARPGPVALTHLAIAPMLALNRRKLVRKPVKRADY